MWVFKNYVSQSFKEQKPFKHLTEDHRQIDRLTEKNLK